MPFLSRNSIIIPYCYSKDPAGINLALNRTMGINGIAEIKAVVGEARVMRRI